MNDSEKSVREAAARPFYHPEFYEGGDAGTLLDAFIHSSAFEEHLDDTLNDLKNTNALLTLFSGQIQGLVDRFAKSTSGPPWQRGAYLLPEVVLRLYEQSENKSGERQTCKTILDSVLSDHLSFDLLSKIG